MATSGQTALPQVPINFGGVNNTSAPTVGTKAPASPTVPAPVPTSAPTGQTSTTQAPATPTTVVSSQPAAQQVQQKIAPALTQAQTDIASQNALKAAATAPTPTPATPATPPAAPATSAGAAKTPEQQIADTPDAGHQFAYDAQGNRVQVEIGNMPPGYTTANPTVAPTQGVADQATDTVGNTYKQFADGTYGKFDATGAYQGVASATDFQNTKAGESIFSSLQQALNGTYPLTPNQQAQVDGIKQQFQTLIDQQKIANDNFTGGTTVAENLYGMGNSLTGLGEIKGTVDAGIAKIADLNSKMTSAVTQMESAFQTDNLNMLKDAYDIYNTTVKSRQDEIDKLHQAATDAANTTRQYNLDVAKFKQTGDQNAFQNALATEQEAHAEATQAETARHDKATEAIDAFKAGMGAGGGASVAGITQSAQVTESGNPDPASQKAVLDQITQQYGPMTATAIKSLADYSMNPMDWKAGSTKGMTRDQAVTLAKMYDPTYNDAQFSVRQTYMKNLASNSPGSIGSAVNSANKAINHLTDFATTMNKITTPGTAGLMNANTVAAAKTQAIGVADELAKFFKGTGSTDVGSIEAWQKQISPGASRNAVKGTVQGAVDLLAGQLQSLSEQYQNTMGKTPTNNFLGASAMASLSSLKNQGYTVDIPGVLYTDKNAYLQNDAGAQANMTAATQQLQAAGLPLTPENILQLAQNQ